MGVEGGTHDQTKNQQQQQKIKQSQNTQVGLTLYPLLLRSALYSILLCSAPLYSLLSFLSTTIFPNDIPRILVSLFACLAFPVSVHLIFQPHIFLLLITCSPIPTCLPSVPFPLHPSHSHHSLTCFPVPLSHKFYFPSPRALIYDPFAMCVLISHLRSLHFPSHFIIFPHFFVPYLPVHFLFHLKLRLCMIPVFYFFYP